VQTRWAGRVLGRVKSWNMTTLVFAQGCLLDGTRELARTGVDGTLNAGGGKYEIARTESHGWHYAVRELAGERIVCEFEPLWVRRGGSLRSNSLAVRLRGRPFRPRAWRFTTEAGQSIETASKPVRSDVFKFQVRLSCEESLAQVPSSDHAGFRVLVDSQLAGTPGGRLPKRRWCGVGPSPSRGRVRAAVLAAPAKYLLERSLAEHRLGPLADNV
jgi:hypothetical protein